MFQDRSNKPRTQIHDLVDESSQPSILSLSDLQLIKGGRMEFAIYREACSCAVGGDYDYDGTLQIILVETP